MFDKMSVGPKLHCKMVLVLFLTGFAGQVFAQEDINFEDLLQRVDTVENPVYKPVLSIAYGTLNFMGDVRSSSRLPVVGNPAFRVNVSTFIDNQHHVTANFFFLAGTLTGNQQSVTDLEKNLNFSSGIYGIGATARYEFGHLIREEMKLRPHVAIGIEQLNFNSKGDLYDAQNRFYHYWPDGTTRTIPAGEAGAALPLYRDHVFETDLRSFESESYGLGDYNQRSFGIPVEIGFTMELSERIAVSVGTEYHYTFTDFIDNVAYEGTHVAGNKGNDGFLFTQATLHFDMFSDPATRTVDLLYADLEMDPVFFGDEDGDFVLDVADRCPGTPYGVLVDTLGCPLDRDSDGVPDYLDKEPDTEMGVWVDEHGVTLSEEEFLVHLQRDRALNREDLEAYLELIRDRFVERGVAEVPEKFEELDTDGDGYISFDELLKAIDEYFDFEVDLSLDELRQVNEFFFSQ
jgi:hypothetical protein